MPDGGRLALHADRFVHHASEVTETVLLVHLASVRVAFERNERKLHWAIGLLGVALPVALSAGPLQSAIASLRPAFAATERAFVVRGRNGLPVSFAEAVAEQLPGARE